MNNLIVLDVETGGKKADQNPITEVALQVINGTTFELMHTFRSLVKPYNNLEIEKEALEYTRVSMQQINKEGVEVNLVFKSLLEAIKAANKSGKEVSRPMFVGHNFVFDIQFLEYLFTYKNKNLYDYIDRTFWCTMRMMKNKEAGSLKSSDVQRYTLTACCERMGISLKTAHGAAADVEATKQLYIALIKQFRNVSNSNNDVSVSSESGSGITIKSGTKKSRESFFFEI